MKTAGGIMKKFLAVHGVRASVIRALTDQFRYEFGAISPFELAIEPVGVPLEVVPAPITRSGIRSRESLFASVVEPTKSEPEDGLHVLLLTAIEGHSDAFEAQIQAIMRAPRPPNILVLDLGWPHAAQIKRIRERIPSSVALFLRLSWTAIERIERSKAIWSALLGQYASFIQGVWFDGRVGPSWVDVDVIEPFIQRADDQGVCPVITMPMIVEPELWHLLRDHPTLSLDLVQPASDSDGVDLERFADNLHALALSLAHAESDRVRLVSSF